MALCKVRIPAEEVAQYNRQWVSMQTAALVRKRTSDALFGSIDNHHNELGAEVEEVRQERMSPRPGSGNPAAKSEFNNTMIACCPFLTHSFSFFNN